MTGESQFWPILIPITNAWPVLVAKIGACTLFNSILTDPRTDAQRTDRVLQLLVRNKKLLPFFNRTEIIQLKPVHVAIKGLAVR